MLVRTPAFILANDHLTYDPARPSLCTDEPHICYGVKVPAPVPPSPPSPAPSAAAGAPSGISGGGGFGGLPYLASPAAAVDVCRIFAKDVAKRLVSDVSKSLKDLRTSRSGKSPCDNVVKAGIIRGLRHRITCLEAWIRDLKRKFSCEVEDLLFELHLGRMVAEDLEAKVAGLEAALDMERARSAALESRLSRATAQPFAPEASPIPAAALLIVGVVGYAAVEVLVPDRLGAGKNLGRAAASFLAVNGAMALLFGE